jgi:hypothetical protein
MRIAGKIRVILAAIFIIWIALPWSSVWWHVRHGNGVMLDGYTVHLPLTWSPDASRSDRDSVTLTKVFSLISPTALNCCTWMELSVMPKPFHEDTFGVELAKEWQHAIEQRPGRHAETIQAQQHLLICISGNFPSKYAVELYYLTCRVIGTKIFVSTQGSSSTVREARAMWTQTF